MFLEWDSSLANSCSVIKKRIFRNKVFAIFHFFSVTFLPVARKKSILTQITIHTRQSNRLSIRKTIFRFPPFFACRNLLLIAKKNRCPHLRTKSLSMIM